MLLRIFMHLILSYLILSYLILCILLQFDLYYTMKNVKNRLLRIQFISFLNDNNAADKRKRCPPPRQKYMPLVSQQI